MTDLLEVYKEARDRIADPEHWTVDDYARTSEGRHVNPDDSAATCWCAVGSLLKSLNARAAILREFGTSNPEIRPLNDAGEHIVKREMLATDDYQIGWYAPVVNDVGGHERTLEMYDLAIKSLGG